MLLLMKVERPGMFIAFSFTGKSIIGMAEISTFGNPMNDMVACLTKGGLYRKGGDCKPPLQVSRNDYLLRDEFHSDPHSSNDTSQFHPDG